HDKALSNILLLTALNYSYTKVLRKLGFLISASASRVLRASFLLSFSALIKVIFILFVSLFG
ncbi:hypothetical protein, partial [Bacteroides uniformis]|uniref:hypothetical protein n=1 Tax=Bacteroides uniformis TaxID=820 RepID=UPI001959A652